MPFYLIVLARLLKYSTKMCYNSNFIIHPKSRSENQGVEIATELMSDHLLDIMVHLCNCRLKSLCFPPGFLAHFFSCYIHE